MFYMVFFSPVFQVAALFPLQINEYYICPCPFCETEAIYECIILDKNIKYWKL